MQHGTVRTILRLEGLFVMLAALLAYGQWGQGWGRFALWFLLPDISLLAYLAGPRLGALSYNVAHSHVGAIACLVLGFWFRLPAISTAGLIWCAHIGFDRVLGYGLKYGEGFRYTHLGLIGHGPLPGASNVPGNTLRSRGAPLRFILRFHLERSLQAQLVMIRSSTAALVVFIPIVVCRDTAWLDRSVPGSTRGGGKIGPDRLCADLSCRRTLNGFRRMLVF
jgi:hypothetical protein